MPYTPRKKFGPFEFIGGCFGILVIGFISIIALLVIGTCGISVKRDLSGESAKTALENAREYASHLPNVTAIECAQYDTDHDNYISCTLFRGEADPLQIECGDWLKGCREPKVNMRGLRRY